MTTRSRSCTVISDVTSDVTVEFSDNFTGTTSTAVDETDGKAVKRKTGIKQCVGDVIIMSQHSCEGDVIQTPTIIQKKTNCCLVKEDFQDHEGTDLFSISGFGKAENSTDASVIVNRRTDEVYNNAVLMY